jgi:hypothetical protein
VGGGGRIYEKLHHLEIFCIKLFVFFFVTFYLNRNIQKHATDGDGLIVLKKSFFFIFFLLTAKFSIVVVN